MEQTLYSASPSPDRSRRRLDSLRAAVARIERGGARPGPPPLPFGLPALDAALPGGLRRGALHEVMGYGPDLAAGAAPARFAAGILARLPGPVLWVTARGDLFPPGLASAGLLPERVLFARAGREVLAVMEEGLRHRGLAGVVGEVPAPLSLTASRRLHLAAEASGVMALVLYRPWPGDQMKGAPGVTAAATRWRVAPLPAPPPLPHAPEVPGLGPARWRLELLRCRGGRTGSWEVEACDASGRLGLVSPLVHGPAAARPSRDRPSRYRDVSRRRGAA